MTALFLELALGGPFQPRGEGGGAPLAVSRERVAAAAVLEHGAARGVCQTQRLPFLAARGGRKPFARLYRERHLSRPHRATFRLGARGSERPAPLDLETREVLANATQLRLCCGERGHGVPLLCTGAIEQRLQTIPKRRHAALFTTAGRRDEGRWTSA